MTVWKSNAYGEVYLELLSVVAEMWESFERGLWSDLGVSCCSGCSESSEGVGTTGGHGGTLGSYLLSLSL